MEELHKNASAFMKDIGIWIAVTVLDKEIFSSTKIALVVPHYYSARKNWSERYIDKTIYFCTEKGS